jgi:hypothetical protein
MPSPFPGVDPYLEAQGFWPDLHARFITYWCDLLADRLPENYEARMDDRVNLVDLRIEEETRETYIDILHRPNRTLVAVLEFLSPANKEEPGRSSYLAKRNALLHEPVHLVEVDLLTGGLRPPLSRDYPPGDYFALVARANRRPDCDVYAWTVRQPLPAIPIPLRPPDPDVWISLAEVFALTYERGRYARSVDYSAPLTVSLSDADLAWAQQTARAARR